MLFITPDDMLSAGQCAEIVDKKMILHRVHREKTYCVDNGSLSIGRDNLYQSYHDEHGIWVEDQGAIKLLEGEILEQSVEGHRAQE